MTKQDAAVWNERYRQGTGPMSRRAALRLAAYEGPITDLAVSLQAEGRRPQALDLACGAGGTLLWLALHGWDVTGVDVSDVALGLAQSACALAGVEERCRLIQADLDCWRPAADSVDLLCSFFFLQRGLWPSMRAAVRPGGLILIETFNQTRLATRPDVNPAYLLQEDELRAEIQSWGWTILVHRSHGAESNRQTDAVLARRPRT